MESCSLWANSGDEGPLIWSGGLECKPPRPAAPTLPAVQLCAPRMLSLLHTVILYPDVPTSSLMRGQIVFKILLISYVILIAYKFLFEYVKRTTVVWFIIIIGPMYNKDSVVKFKKIKNLIPTIRQEKNC